MLQLGLPATVWVVSSLQTRRYVCIELSEARPSNDPWSPTTQNGKIGPKAWHFAMDWKRFCTRGKMISHTGSKQLIVMGTLLSCTYKLRTLLYTQPFVESFVEAWTKTSHNIPRCQCSQWSRTSNIKTSEAFNSLQRVNGR